MKLTKNIQSIEQINQLLEKFNATISLNNVLNELFHLRNAYIYILLNLTYII